jgi:formate--tetrahydrofolate ligase
VREARLAAGAGFVVASTGSIVTMPGLPREPAALHVRVQPDGRIRGLMAGDRT